MIINSSRTEVTVAAAEPPAALLSDLLPWKPVRFHRVTVETGFPLWLMSSHGPDEESRCVSVDHRMKDLHL